MSTRRKELAKRLGQLVANTWRIEALIGVGGMGAVYKGVHVRNLHRVAIKILHADVVSHSETIVPRFLREGYVANKLNHPAVVPAIDDGTLEDGSPYLVMEFLDGYSLDEHVSHRPNVVPLRPPMTETEAAGVLEVLVDVLASAERLNVVHRDLKPGNVFRVADGTYRVLDFGIAMLDERLSEASTPLTEPGIAVGTPSYMPPEQALARRDLVGPHSDCFSAAATVYSLLTGRPPRSSDSFAEAFVLAMTTPMAPIASLVSIRPAFAAVIDKALSFEQKERFADAAEMAAALRAAFQPHPALHLGRKTESSSSVEAKVSPGTPMSVSMSLHTTGESLGAETPLTHSSAGNAVASRSNRLRQGVMGGLVLLTVGFLAAGRCSAPSASIQGVPVVSSSQLENALPAMGSPRSPIVVSIASPVTPPAEVVPAVASAPGPNLVPLPVVSSSAVPPSRALRPRPAVAGRALPSMEPAAKPAPVNPLEDYK